MNINNQSNRWLPITQKEIKAMGWSQPDVILFSGDAYVDHPSFGTAVIGRLLESLKLKVAIVPQPNWQDDLRDFKKFGEPRLFFGVTAGNMDSMVNHYTAGKRKRSDDAYTPGGNAGQRPDYATSIYAKLLKQLYPNTPVIAGGIEASLRRFTHYDYWNNKLLPSILEWSHADMIIYGMAEKPLIKIITLLEKGVPFNSLTTIEQTVIKQSKKEPLPKNKKWKDIELYSHEECVTSKKRFAINFKTIEEISNSFYPPRLHQICNSNRIIVNPPDLSVSENDLDKIYRLPFTRMPHPKYKNKKTIPAYEMIKHSVVLHRGCFGGCSFCTISAHQGKFVISRSKKSILNELKQVVKMDDFKGYISDLGGPSANMYKMEGKDISKCEKCKRPSCIFPAICSNLNTSHKPLLDLYKNGRSIEEIKKIFIGSGIRYDLLLNKNISKEEKENNSRYITEVIKHHVSGRLKIAPEHSSNRVLKTMRKPSFNLFKEFNAIFKKGNNELNLKQQLIPYFISSHPESHDEDMVELALETKNLNFKPEQVQDFTPTPMTLSTAMYYTGIDPYTLKPLYIPSGQKQKERQRMFFFWYKPQVEKQIKSLYNNSKIKPLIERLFDKKVKQK
ncbi:YgiQ family radical SAM protein [Marinilabiliaceae bacterium ANBcel2]|nr:YgiQ family radical SAM protein [Marinilabiliaceae bacterium ANBcel2]